MSNVKRNTPGKFYCSDAEELIEYFKTAVLPTEPIWLDKCTRALNCRKMVDNSLVNLEIYKGRHRFEEPIIIRLRKLKAYIEQSGKSTTE
ncbi:DUF6965 family protein [Dyadobacter sp.]|uniref:DUF6965 family protein n=1 Tax=Dyadobacter sp. TaxID=1914288 RepID=UPI0038D4446E